MEINSQQIQNSINQSWDDDILPQLIEYIKIPCLSVDFDPQWQANPYMGQAKVLALKWLEQHATKEWVIHSKTLEGRTPLLLIEIPGDADDTVLMYGHLDKQPEMEGWWPGYGPWIPVINDEKLYGRGGADDGYALFSAVAAIQSLKQQNIKHSRIVVLIEFSEESGSPHLPDYLQLYQSIIGSPHLVIALDSCAGDYQRLWSTTSLRGMLSCQLKISVLTEATHSGAASGIVPSSMRIIRVLLDRLENSETGEILLSDLYSDIPKHRIDQAELTAQILGKHVFSDFNTTANLKPVTTNVKELLLNNAWRPTLSVVGQEGIPISQKAGNVTRAYTTLKLSFRLPPSIKLDDAKIAIRQALTHDIPYDADVSLSFDQGGEGWSAPAVADWLKRASSEASEIFFDEDAMYYGLGMSIPFMSMLGDQFPQAQFLITGVLGPKSNAHGPNEFINIPYAKKLTACVAYIIASQYRSL